MGLDLWSNQVYQEERYKALLREAEQQARFAGDEVSEANAAPSWRDRLADRLGRFLIAWGWRLRARSGQLQ
ncbi:hypothetical protein HC891_24035 [Candidatus Gracilibacteria bacterium]|nr:hypothetical protein [Candidatus Gracilibacteria bacterium]